MHDQHYTHTCQVCKTEFPATLNKDGTPRQIKIKVCSPLCRGRHSRKVERGEIEKPRWDRVFKECILCGKSFGPMTERLAEKTYCCSRSCSSLIKAKNRGYNIEHKERHCHGCNKPFTRRVRPTRDSGTHCSRECYFYADARISKERKFLRYLAELQSRRHSSLESKLKLEVSALRRISIVISSRIIECDICQKSHVKRRPWSRQCSRECEQHRDIRQKERNREYKKQRRKTEEGKASRRKQRARRRARMRGAGVVESIDPIAVFENANWVCHICGGKTLKSKRGTYHDRAPELEHIVALANGGTHTWSNVACACRKCNIEKGASDYGQMGLL